jgi:hypothetical protein
MGLQTENSDILKEIKGNRDPVPGVEHFAAFSNF